MDASESWRELFKKWPPSMPRTGILVTTFDEIIPFVNFMTSGGILLVERERPDSNDARKVMVSYSAIAALKSATTADLDKFKTLGFS